MLVWKTSFREELSTWKIEDSTSSHHPFSSSLLDVQSLCTHNLSTRRAHNGKYDERDYLIHLCGAGCLCAQKKNENRTERREEEEKSHTYIFRIATAAKKQRRHSERVREENNVWMNVSDRTVVSLCSNARAMYARRSPVVRLYVWTRYTSWAKITIELRVENCEEKGLARVKSQPYTKINLPWCTPQWFQSN